VVPFKLRPAPRCRVRRRGGPHVVDSPAWTRSRRRRRSPLRSARH